MRRSILLAIALSALLWTADARTGSPPQGTVAASGTGSCLMPDDSHGPSDADQQWRAQHHTVAAVTEAAWKSSPVRAELAGTRAAQAFAIAGAASSPDPPVRPAPHYLRHTPLLI